MIGIGPSGPRGEDDVLVPPRKEPPRPSGDGDERAHWIALASVPGIGPVSFASLLARHGSALAAWGAGEAALRDLPRPDEDTIPAYRRMRRRGAAEIAHLVERETAALGGVVCTPLDRGYPPSLMEVAGRPPVLHVLGRLDTLATRSVAVVGTRRASGYGLTAATELGDELARAGITVTSGLAIGIDGAAHAAAIRAGGTTVAVLPSPVGRVYPPRHRRLADEIVASGGALVSEIAARQAIGRPDFARRNRIIAGLSVAVVIVEAPDQSGALLTAQAAMAMGRELFAVPGPIHADLSRGSNRLIADHQADLVTSAPGLLSRIGVASGERPPSVASLSDTEGLVLGQLLRRAGSIEELIDRTSSRASVIAAALTLLEARGLVSAFGGATFHPTLAARRLAGFV